VTRTSVRAYLARQRERYHRLSRSDRSRLLTEMVAATGYHRKAVLRCLSLLAPRRVGGRAVGRPRRYGADVASAAQILWQAVGQIGAKRLQPFVPALLDRLVACGKLTVRPATAALVRQMSISTLERLLAGARRTSARRARSTTQPGGWLKHQIPVRTFADWDDARPGFLEIDLVATAVRTAAGSSCIPSAPSTSPRVGSNCNPSRAKATNASAPRCTRSAGGYPCASAGWTPITAPNSSIARCSTTVASSDHVHSQSAVP
jgi:hypothetical protein